MFKTCGMKQQIHYFNLWVHRKMSRFVTGETSHYLHFHLNYSSSGAAIMRRVRYYVPQRSRQRTKNEFR